MRGSWAPGADTCRCWESSAGRTPHREAPVLPGIKSSFVRQQHQPLCNCATKMDSQQIFPLLISTHPPIFIKLLIFDYLQFPSVCRQLTLFTHMEGILRQAVYVHNLWPPDESHTSAVRCCMLFCYLSSLCLSDFNVVLCKVGLAHQQTLHDINRYFNLRHQDLLLRNIRLVIQRVA